MSQVMEVPPGTPAPIRQGWLAAVVGQTATRRTYTDAKHHVHRSPDRDASWHERHGGTRADSAARVRSHKRLTHARVIPASEYDPAMDYARAYATAVVDGFIMAGPLVRAACRRHLADIERAAEPDSDLWYDHGAAEHFAIFCERWLRHYAGQFAGDPLVLEPAQEFICGNLFGWRMWREGYPRDDPSVWPRRFRRAYLEIGKGNGKTPLMAAIGLYGLVADNEPAAEIYVGASKTKQAHVCYQDAVRMARGSPLIELLRTVGVNPVYQIDHLPSESSMQLLSRESGKSESGIRPHIVLLDEIHEHQDNSLIDMMQRGFKWRRQPLLVMATNSGDSVMNVAWEEHEHATEVLMGRETADESFSFVCGHDPGEDPLEDESCWPKSNPLIGVSQSVHALRAAVKDARSYPARAANVRRLHFCQWAESTGDWIDTETWRAAEVEQSDEGMIRWVGMDRQWPVVAAIDLSKSQDLTSVAYISEVPAGLDDVEPVYRVAVRSYTPGEMLEEREREDRVPYAAWARTHPETFRVLDGPVVEHEAVAADLLDDLRRLDLRALVYDTWDYAGFQRTLTLMGWPDDVHQVEHPQGWSYRRNSPLRMPDSIGAIERMLKQRRLRVYPSPSLRAAVTGARMTISASGSARWDKKTSRARIDALVAMTMALGAWDAGLSRLRPADAKTDRRDRIRAYYAAYAQHTMGA